MYKRQVHAECIKNLQSLNQPVLKFFLQPWNSSAELKPLLTSLRKNNSEWRNESSIGASKACGRAQGSGCSFWRLWMNKVEIRFKSPAVGSPCFPWASSHKVQLSQGSCCQSSLHTACPRPLLSCFSHEQKEEERHGCCWRCELLAAWRAYRLLHSPKHWGLVGHLLKVSCT